MTARRLHPVTVAITGWATLALTTFVASGVVQANSSSAAMAAQNAWWLLIGTVFLGTASIVVVRRPRLSLGWLLLLPSVNLTLEAASTVAGLGDSGWRLWLYWAAQMLWAPTVLPLITLLVLLFPTGRLPSRRWRPIAIAAWAALSMLTIGNAIHPTLLDEATNPVAVGSATTVETTMLLPGLVLLLVAVIGAIASLVVRFRTSTGVERAQLRWFRAGAGLAFASWLVAMAFEAAGRQDIGGSVFGAGLVVLPIAVAIAVLRYRLFDIDRVVSRTVSYALLTSVLVGVYGLGVLGVGALLPGEPSELLVAGSTLAVAALFRPLRTRFQEIVDRRFNRARYDAAETLDAFAERLRAQIDLLAFREDLLETTRASVEPQVAVLWLPAP